MDLSTIFAMIGSLIALGPVLDKITTPTFKNLLYQNILLLNRRTFAVYVAGTALSVFERIFDRRFRSLRFLTRSALLTLVVSIFSLLFLYVYFPQTYYAATSYIRKSLEFGQNYPAAFLPVFIFFLFDYLCNGKTKLFLEMMKSSRGIGQCFVVGYSDLVVTHSIATLSLAISFTIFSYLCLTSPINSVAITLDFSRLHNYEEFSSDDVKHVRSLTNFLYRMGVALSYTKDDDALNQRDFELAKTHSKLPEGGDIRYTRNDKFHLIQFVNSRGVVTKYITDKDALNWSNLITVAANNSSDDQFCRRLSTSIQDAKFAFIVHRGWSESRIHDACRNGEQYKLDLDISVKPTGFDFKDAAGTMVGALVTLSVSSVTKGFPYYLSFGPVEIYKFHRAGADQYYFADDQAPEAFIQAVLETAWRLRHGAYRVVENGGYPWSTFYVVTMLTSSFIWIVIVFTTLAYPPLWLLEKVGGQNRLFKLHDYPWSIIFLVVGTYIFVLLLIVRF